MQILQTVALTFISKRPNGDMNLLRLRRPERLILRLSTFGYCIEQLNETLAFEFIRVIHRMGHYTAVGQSEKF